MSSTRPPSVPGNPRITLATQLLAFLGGAFIFCLASCGCNGCAVRLLLVIRGGGIRLLCLVIMQFSNGNKEICDANLGNRLLLRANEAK